MPRSTQAVYSFGSGVLSPSMEMRADSQNYQRASRVMRNFVVTPQGGITRRHGSEYIGDQKDGATNVGRLFTFHRGGNESDILIEMTEQNTRYWLEDALLQAEGGGDLETTSDYLWAMLRDVQAVNQENLFVSVHPDAPPLLTTISQDNTIVAERFPAGKVPKATFEDLFAATAVSSDVTYQLRFSTSFITGDVFDFTYNGKTNFTTGAEPDAILYPYSGVQAEMEATLTRACDDHPDIGAGTGTTVNVAQVAADVYNIQLVGPFAGRTMVLLPFGSADNSISVEITAGDDPKSLEEPAWSYPFVVTHTPGTTYYQAKAPHRSDSTNEPGTGVSWTDFWTALPGKPDWFDWQHSEGSAWATDTVYAPWGRGFPRTVTFHQQRLYFGGTDNSFAGGITITPTGAPALPATIWGSRIDEYTDFAVGANDSDPVQFTLSTRGVPAISWMTSLQGLLVGTTAGHYRIGANSTLTPTTLNVQKQNGARSAIDTPLTINNRVFSVQLGNTTLHSAAYSREALAILVDDVSVASNHLFERGVNELSLMQVPEDLIFAIRFDGTIVVLTFVPETQIAAWYEWDTAGEILHGTTIYNERTQQEELYLIVERDLVRYIEKIIYPPSDFARRANLDGLCYMDSYERGTLTNSDTITVPTRMTNKTVRVTVNDGDLGEFTAVGTTVTLPQSFNGYYYVGFSYVADVQTFERIEGNPQGVAFGTKRRWNKLYARLIDSALPKIEGTRPPDRSPPSLMDLPEPLRNEDVRVHNIGYNDGSVVIEADLPFPTHIAGLYGQIGTYDV